MAETIESVIGSNIRTARHKAGLTQGQLGKAVAPYMGKPLSIQAVSEAERGSRAFAASDILCLAKVLGTTVPKLFAVPADTQLATATEETIVAGDVLGHVQASSYLINDVVTLADLPERKLELMLAILREGGAR